MQPMSRGVILAAGRGLRLDPISTPKPMVCIGTKPLVILTIDYLQRLGIDEIWIVLGRQGELVQKEILGNRGVKSAIHYLELPQGSRSMLHSFAHACGKIPGSFLLTACDLVFEKYPLAPADASFIDPTLLQVVTAPVRAGHRSGTHSSLSIDSDGNVTRVGPGFAGDCFYDTGIYLVGEDTKSCFTSGVDSVSDRQGFNALLFNLFQTGRARVKQSDPGEWYDVNTPVDRIKAEMLLKRKTRPPVDPVPAASPPDLLPLNVSFEFAYEKKKRTEIIVQNGILKDLWNHDLLPAAAASSRHFLVTDVQLYESIGKEIEDGFNARGYSVSPLLVPVGEKAKKLEEYWRLASEVLSSGIDRHSIILNLGGGAVNNVAGFLASTIFRGIGLIHIPTTLLAQIDSAVDIKHAINTPYGKNLVGSLFAPDKVIIDPDVLQTLSDGQIANGLSESIKHAIAQDAGFLKFYHEYAGPVRDPVFLDHVIQKTLALKVETMGSGMAQDHAEMIKDYGHGIGHALEQFSGYVVHHGRGISVGMCVSAEIAHLLKIAKADVVEQHYSVLKKYGLTVYFPPDIDLDSFGVVLKHDKTYIQGNVCTGLVSHPGRLWSENGKYCIPIDYEIVRRAMQINQGKGRPDAVRKAARRSEKSHSEDSRSSQVCARPAV